MAEDEYRWQDNQACRATYEVFTDKDFKQLRADSVSFEQAGPRTMGSMPFFNHSMSAARRKKHSRLWAQEFLLYLKDIYPLVPEDQTVPLDTVYDRLAAVLSEKTKTLAHFAGAVDAAIKFPQEA